MEHVFISICFNVLIYLVFADFKNYSRQSISLKKESEVKSPRDCCDLTNLAISEEFRSTSSNQVANFDSDSCNYNKLYMFDNIYNESTKC